MEELEREKDYLRKTIRFIEEQIIDKGKALDEQKVDLAATRRDLWENGVHFTDDFDKLTELNQYLTTASTSEIKYKEDCKQIEDYKKILKKPYFARFDFIENGEDEESIYMGMKNVIDDVSYKIWIYDWRAPICSVFYQYGLEAVSYAAPNGDIKGEVILKRQYNIKKGELKYYVDCDGQINDEMLLYALSQNASPKMKNIIKTIQKEQDIIIRDTQNQIVIVQGVAGSGKTSVALHRIAFLLYHGMNHYLTSNNILILSPNEVFSQYISDVLPELGEENVCQMTCDQITAILLGKRFKIEDKMQFLERLMLNEEKEELELRKKSIIFKTSKDFKILLERLISCYIKNYIPFQDVYYNGHTIIDKELLKNQVLSNKINISLSKKLKRLRMRIMNAMHPIEKEYLKSIQSFIIVRGGWEFQEKAISRLLLYKRFQVIYKQIKAFTEVDYLEVYQTVFKDSSLFYKLADGLVLPEFIDEILQLTYQNIKNGYVEREDASALLFIKLTLEGTDLFTDIKQVVIDEAQDYSYLEYEIFKMLFKEARLTVVGDRYQIIDEREDELPWYDSAEQIFHNKTCTKLFLNKGYRCAQGISLFSQKILGTDEQHISVERNSQEPVCYYKESNEAINKAIMFEVQNVLENGYESVAVLGKSLKDSKRIYEELAKLFQNKSIQLADNKTAVGKGITVMPVYLAKGLEFDVVIIYNVSYKDYFSELDRKVLYIASTRALHQLIMYYTDEKSRWIPNGYEGEADGTI